MLVQRVHKAQSVLRDFKESRDQRDLPEYRDPLDHKERGGSPDRRETWAHQVPPAPQLRGEHEREETRHQICPLLSTCPLCREKKENRGYQVPQVLKDNKVNQDLQEEEGHRVFQGSTAAGGHQGHEDKTVRPVSQVNKALPASKVPLAAQEPMGCQVWTEGEANLDQWESQVYQVTLELPEEMAHPDKMAHVENEERKENPVDLVPLANEGRGDEGPRERGERREKLANPE